MLLCSTEAIFSGTNSEMASLVFVQDPTEYRRGIEIRPIKLLAIGGWASG